MDDLKEKITVTGKITSWRKIFESLIIEIQEATGNIIKVYICKDSIDKLKIGDHLYIRGYITTKKGVVYVQAESLIKL